MPRLQHPCCNPSVHRPMGFRHFWRRGAAPLRLQRVRLGDCHRTKPFPLLTNPEWRVSNSRRDLPAKSNIAGAPSKRKARPRRSNAEWRTPPGFVTQPRRERNITKRAKSVTVWPIQPDPPEERRLQAVARKHLPPAKWSRRRPTTKPAATAGVQKAHSRPQVPKEQGKVHQRP